MAAPIQTDSTATRGERDDRPRVIALMGPTAAGKTSVSLAMARELKGEVISADAVAVYRGFDIGSAKPTPEEMGGIRHHLIDVAGADEDFNAASFADLAGRAVTEISAAGRTPIVAGGTGLYFKALLHGLFQAPPVDPDLRREIAEAAAADPAASHARLAGVDPRAAARLEINDTVRVVRALEIYLQTGRAMSDLQAEHAFQQRPYRHLKLGLAIDRHRLAERIAMRAEMMFNQGLVAEVAGLLDSGVSPRAKPMRSIGYRQAAGVAVGTLSLDQALAETMKETKRLAKRQMTWFRADQEILWLPAEDSRAFVQTAKSFLEQEDAQA